MIPDDLLPRPGDGVRWRVAARASTWGPVRPWDRSDWMGALAAKRELIARFPDLVTAAVDGSHAACIEAAEIVAGCSGAGEGLADLVTAALGVPDDLVVLDTAHARGPRIIAGVVCAPNRWRLGDKVGRAMAEVHGPVPRYGEQVGAATDSLLLRLSPERPVRRANWAVLADRAPHQSRDWSPGRICEPARLWLRVEDQGLVRLARTGAALFTIRTHQERLADLLRRAPSAVADLAAAVASLPEDIAAYKSIVAHREALCRWADQVV